jgi:hypothetical protein
MKLKEKLKEYEKKIELQKGVIRILEADVRRARYTGAQDLALALMRAYSAFDRGHMVSVADIMEDIAFFSKKYTEGK